MIHFTLRNKAGYTGVPMLTDAIARLKREISKKERVFRVRAGKHQDELGSEIGVSLALHQQQQQQQQRG